MAYQMFNSQLTQFVSQLQRAFPEEQPLITLQQKLAAVSAANIRAPLEAFHRIVTDHMLDIMCSNERVIPRLEKVLPGIGRIWSKADEDTRQCMWQHVQTLASMAEVVCGLDMQTMQQLLQQLPQRLPAMQPQAATETEPE